MPPKMSFAEADLRKEGSCWTNQSRRLDITRLWKLAGPCYLRYVHSAMVKQVVVKVMPGTDSRQIITNYVDMVTCLGPQVLYSKRIWCEQPHYRLCLDIPCIYFSNTWVVGVTLRKHDNWKHSTSGSWFRCAKVRKAADDGFVHVFNMITFFCCLASCRLGPAIVLLPCSANSCIQSFREALHCSSVQAWSNTDPRNTNFAKLVDLQIPSRETHHDVDHTS
jgi:hypothetical protein